MEISRPVLRLALSANLNTRLPPGQTLVALDIKQTGVLQGLPLQFSGNNLVKSIRAGTPQDTQTLRLLVDLTEDGKTRAVKQQNGSNYTVVFTINADAPPPPPPPAGGGETGRSRWRSPCVRRTRAIRLKPVTTGSPAMTSIRA
jgi:hypothetical protein